MEQNFEIICNFVNSKQEFAFKLLKIRSVMLFLL